MRWVDSSARRQRTVTTRIVIAVLATVVSTAVGLSDVETTRAGMQRPALTLLSQSAVVAGAEGSSFMVSVRLSSPLVESLDDSSRIVLTSHRPVTSRAEVEDAIDGNLPQIIDAVGFALTDVLDRSVRDFAQVDLIVPTEIGRRTPDALQMSATGLYPLTIEIETAGERIIGLVSFIERLEPNSFSPPEAPTLDLSLVGRLDAPVSLVDTQSVVSASNRASLSDWVTVLENRPGFIATIAVRPELLESFTRSTPDDRELLIRLQRSAAFDVMSTTYVAMDPTDADRHGLVDVFTRQLRLGETTLSSLFPERIAPRHSWLVSDTLSSGGARVLADLGFRTTVLTPNALESTDVDSSGFDPTRLIEFGFSDEGMIMGAIVDSRLAASLERSSFRPTGGAHLAAHQMLADLKMMYLEMTAGSADPSAHALVLTTPTGELPSATMSQSLWDLVARDSRFAFVTLDDAITKMLDADNLERVDLPVSFDETNPFPASATLWAALRSLESTVDAFGSVLPRADERVREWQHVLDVLPDNRLSTAQRQSHMDAVRFATQEIATSVVPPASTTFTLGGRDSPIRFSVRNDADTDLEVLIRLTSPKLRLPEGDKIVTLPARTSTAVEFSVSARTNGRFPVELQLLTPVGEVLLGPPSTLTARVNALAGLGQLVTGIALLFLASWWISHFRRQYRQRQSEAALSSTRHPSSDRSS